MTKSEYIASLNEIFKKHDEIITQKNKELLEIFDLLRSKMNEIKQVVQDGNDEIQKLNDDSQSQFITPYHTHEFKGYYHEHFEKLFSNAPGGIYSMIKSCACGHNYR